MTLSLHCKYYMVTVCTSYLGIVQCGTFWQMYVLVISSTIASIGSVCNIYLGTLPVGKSCKRGSVNICMLSA